MWFLKHKVWWSLLHRTRLRNLFNCWHRWIPPWPQGTVERKAMLSGCWRASGETPRDSSRRQLCIHEALCRENAPLWHWEAAPQGTAGPVPAPSRHLTSAARDVGAHRAGPAIHGSEGMKQNVHPWVIRGTCSLHLGTCPGQREPWGPAPCSLEEVDEHFLRETSTCCI